MREEPSEFQQFIQKWGKKPLMTAANSGGSQDDAVERRAKELTSAAADAGFASDLKRHASPYRSLQHYVRSLYDRGRKLTVGKSKREQ